MQYSFVLPYLRSTPIHIPRRDLVVGGADSVLLEVGVVESDDPSAQAIVLTGGIGGPALRMTVWPWSYLHWPTSTRPTCRSSSASSRCSSRRSRS